MPQSLSRVFIHAVFGTKYRRPTITVPVRYELHNYLGGILNEIGCSTVRIGGVEEHVHLLFYMSRTKTLADTIEDVKTGSSKWMKTKGADFADFRWQNGYGAFSVGERELQRVRRYIDRQEAHHHKETFQDEYRAELKRYGIKWDERYVWD